MGSTKSKVPFAVPFLTSIDAPSGIPVKLDKKALSFVSISESTDSKVGLPVLPRLGAASFISFCTSALSIFPSFETSSQTRCRFAGILTISNPLKHYLKSTIII